MLKLHSESHLDHSLTKPQIEHLLALFKDRDGFFIETVTLPENLGTVPCGLFGPLVGDVTVPESEVIYERRGNRPQVSRLVNRQPRPTRQVSVIAGPYREETCVLYTAFGGPVAPFEPGDPALKEADREKSLAFWKEHALAK